MSARPPSPTGPATGEPNVMAMTGGRDRTEGEFAALFADAGIRLSAGVHTGTPVCVIDDAPV